MTPKTVRLHIRRGRLRAVQFEDGPYRVRRDDAQCCGIREHACEILDGGRKAKKRRDRYRI
jgi:hypothetical protein